MPWSGISAPPGSKQSQRGPVQEEPQGLLYPLCVSKGSEGGLGLNTGFMQGLGVGS